MDAFESALKQLGQSTSFDAVRIVDPTDNTVVKERHYHSIKIAMPNYNIKQTKAFYDLCISSKQPVLNLIHKRDIVFLMLFEPVRLFNKNLLSEMITNVTDNIFLDNINLNDQFGVLSEITQLRQKIVTDELTGLYNRRYIDEKLPIEITTCTKHKLPLSVIFSDLDYYKKVNDIYGHAAGDYVLREFARVLSQNIRKDKDWIARYGGEEFIICLNGAGFKKAKEIAERIRIAVMNKSFHYKGQLIKLTCSFGVYTIDDFLIPPTIDEMLDIVDKRLYEAKNLGRNIVVP
jgi:two-component system cell cycle response regulator